MAYEKVFEKTYPGGWKDLPDKTTPVLSGTLDDYDSALEHIENFLDGSTAVKPVAKTEGMTQAVGVDSETGALFTTPGGGGSGEAEDISYDNTESGLESDNVQGAIDELAAGAGSKVTPVEKTEDMTQPVGIDGETGELWTAPGSGSGTILRGASNLTKLYEAPTTAGVNSGTIILNQPCTDFDFLIFSSARANSSRQGTTLVSKDDLQFSIDQNLMITITGAANSYMAFVPSDSTHFEITGVTGEFKIYAIYGYSSECMNIAGDYETVVLMYTDTTVPANTSNLDLALSDNIFNYEKIRIRGYYTYSNKNHYGEQYYDVSIFDTTDSNNIDYWLYYGAGGIGSTLGFRITDDGDAVKITACNYASHITEIAGVKKKVYTPAKDGLIRWFDAINNTGSGYDDTTTTWKDLCGNSDATVSSAASWVDYKFIPGQAIINDFVYDVEVDLTLEAYVTLGQNANQYQGILNNQHISLQINNTNRIEGVVSASTDIRAIADASFSGPFKKVLIDVCYDTTNKKMLVYVNGEKAAEAAYNSIIVDNNSFYIGNYYGQSTYTFRGAIYDIKIYNKLLTKEEIMQNFLYDQARFNGMVVEERTNFNLIKDGLIRWYDGIDNTGEGHDDTATVWKDLSNTENSGTVSDNIWSENCVALYGQHSVDTKLKYTTYSSNPITLDLFVNTGNMQADLQCISDTSGMGMGIQIDSTANKLEYIVHTGNGYDRITTTDTFKRFQDVHVAATFNPNTLISQFYVNGVKIGEHTIAGFNGSSYSMKIGSNGDNNYKWVGAIYDAKIYNRVLTEDEIKQNYQYDLHRFSGLVAGE